MPMALFVSGNSALNIRGQGNLACFTDKGKQITRAVFGEGPKDEAKLGAGVYKQYGKGRDGFDIVSNQYPRTYPKGLACEVARTDIFFKINKLFSNLFSIFFTDCVKGAGRWRSHLPSHSIAYRSISDQSTLKSSVFKFIDTTARFIAPSVRSSTQ